MTTVTVDVQGLAQAGAAIPDRDQITRAARRAINHTNRKDLTRAKRAIGQVLNLKAGYIAGKLRERTAAGDRLEASVEADQRGLLLSRFPYRQLYRTRKGQKRTAGFSVKVLKQGKTKKLRGAFLVPLRNANGQGIAVRTGGGRYPIQVLHGPSVSQVYTRVKDDLQPQAQTDVEARFLHELDRERK